MFVNLGDHSVCVVSFTLQKRNTIHKKYMSSPPYIPLNEIQGKILGGIIKNNVANNVQCPQTKSSLTIFIKSKLRSITFASISPFLYETKLFAVTLIVCRLCFGNALLHGFIWWFEVFCTYGLSVITPSEQFCHCQHDSKTYSMSYEAYIWKSNLNKYLLRFVLTKWKRKCSKINCVSDVLPAEQKSSLRQP